MAPHSDPKSPFHAFQSTALAYPAQPFLHVPASACAAYAAGPIDFTYAQAATAVEQLRKCYEGARLAGCRVLLLLENRPDFFLHFLALNAVGASIVPVNPDYQLAELDHLVAHSEAVLAVTLPEHGERLRQAAQGRLPVLHLEGFEAAITQVNGGGEPAVAAEPQRECALLYTSGTTGKPKGCLLSNRYFVMHGQRYVGRRGYVQLETARSRVLTPLPMFHINALASSTMGMILSAGCIIQLDRFHPRTFWADVVASGATGVHCLGVMPAILLSLPPAPQERQHRLRYGTAANVDPAHHAAFEERFGFPLVEGWSMTETGAGAAISADTEPRHLGTRCIGRVPDVLDVRLADAAGEPVAAGVPGELLVRRKGSDPALGFFSGYLQDEAATREAWRGGWWHTGDIVRMGADGSLHFVDRVKNLIRRSGENISALEVEQELVHHPAVAEVAVTGVADELRGEEVFAFVVLAPGQGDDAQTAASLVDWTLSRLAYHKAPGWVRFLPRLPTTPTQKLERGALKALAAQALAQSLCHDTRSRKRRSAAA